MGLVTVPVRVTWSGSDADSGIRGYELEVSVDGGAWSDRPLASATQVQRRLRVEPGRAYRFRVRATDAAGNVGAWATGSTFRVEALDDRSTAISYATSWKPTVGETAYRGTRTYSERTGNARLTFTGRQVAWVAILGPTRGTARVYVDGVLARTVDLWSETLETRELVFTRAWGTAGTHTIEVRGVGTAGHPRVDVDAFVVLR